MLPKAMSDTSFCFKRCTQNCCKEIISFGMAGVTYSPVFTLPGISAVNIILERSIVRHSLPSDFYAAALKCFLLGGQECKSSMS